MSLRFGNLRQHDLRSVRGLTAWDLAGAELQGARMPDGFTFPLLERAQATASHAQSVFVLLSVAVVYCWLVRLGVHDAEAAVNGPGAELPFLDYRVDILYFYLLSPALLLLVYGYLHLVLQQVVDAVANLPKYFPDGIRVDKHMHAWPLLRYPELFYPDLWATASGGSKCKAFLTIFLMWIMVPASFIANWLHYLAERRPWVSTAHLAVLGLAFALDVRFLFDFFSVLIRSRLEGSNDAPDAAASAHSERVFLVAARQRWFCWSTGAFLALWASAVTYTVAVIGLGLNWPRVFATLNWTGQVLTPVESGSTTTRPVTNFEGRRLDGLRADGAVLANLSFRGATLRGATLAAADLRGADLTGADLRDADLTKANLIGADLTYANLTGANLGDATPQRAQLGQACRLCSRGLSPRPWEVTENLCCNRDRMREWLDKCSTPLSARILESEVSSQLTWICANWTRVDK